MGKAAARITPELLTAKDEGSSSDTRTAVMDAVQLQGDWAKLNEVAFDTARLAWYPYIWNIAVNCIHEGSKVLFPPASPATNSMMQSDPTDVGPLAIKHLGDAAMILLRCCRHWEETRINNDIDCSFLPGALCYAKAMLHWFQWFLWCSGHFSEDVIAEESEAQFTASLRNINMAIFSETRLHEGLRGWERGPVLPIGHRQLCSSLLYAQAISIGDPAKPEILAAAVPATTALARMLAGEGVPQTTITAPLLVPAEPSWPEPGTGRMKRSVAVKRVVIGSYQACQVATAHLKSVLSHVKVSGRSINSKTAAGVMDAGGSVVLWDAVCTYRALKHMLSVGKNGRKHLGVGDAPGDVPEALTVRGSMSSLSMSSFSMSFGRRPTPSSLQTTNPDGTRRMSRTLSITPPSISRSSSFGYEPKSTDYSRRQSTGGVEGHSRLGGKTLSARNLAARLKTAVSGLGRPSSRETSRRPSATDSQEIPSMPRRELGLPPRSEKPAEKPPAEPKTSLVRRATVTLGMIHQRRKGKKPSKSAKPDSTGIISESGTRVRKSTDTGKKAVTFGGAGQDGPGGPPGPSPDPPRSTRALPRIAKDFDPMLMDSPIGFVYESPMSVSRSVASASSAQSTGGRNSINEAERASRAWLDGEFESIGSSEPDLEVRMNSMWDMHNMLSVLGRNAGSFSSGGRPSVDYYSYGGESSGSRKPEDKSTKEGKQTTFQISPPGDSSSESPSRASSVNEESCLSTVLEGTSEDVHSQASRRPSSADGRSHTLAVSLSSGSFRALQHELPSVPGDDNNSE